MNIKCFIIIMFSVLWTLTCKCNGRQIEYKTKSGAESTTNSNSKKYCGARLTESLATLCNGNYPTLRPARIHKKSYWRSQFSNDMPSEFPFQSKQEATSMLDSYGRRRRKRRGVYNECCQKPCSKEQLMMYCAAPSTTDSTSTSRIW